MKTLRDGLMSDTRLHSSVRAPLWVSEWVMEQRLEKTVCPHTHTNKAAWSTNTSYTPPPVSNPTNSVDCAPSVDLFQAHESRDESALCVSSGEEEILCLTNSLCDDGGLLGIVGSQTTRGPTARNLCLWSFNSLIREERLHKMNRCPTFSADGSWRIKTQNIIQRQSESSLGAWSLCRWCLSDSVQQKAQHLSQTGDWKATVSLRPPKHSWTQHSGSFLHCCHATKL